VPADGRWPRPGRLRLYNILDARLGPTGAYQPCTDYSTLKLNSLASRVCSWCRTTFPPDLKANNAAAQDW
jgi:hypothetical protein